MLDTTLITRRTGGVVGVPPNSFGPVLAPVGVAIDSMPGLAGVVVNFAVGWFGVTIDSKPGLAGAVINFAVGWFGVTIDSAQGLVGVVGTLPGIFDSALASVGVVGAGRCLAFLGLLVGCLEVAASLRFRTNVLASPAMVMVTRLVVGLVRVGLLMASRNNS